MPEAWSQLDRRDRGTQFISLASKSLINSSAATKMGFWSVNPYIGCEFGCAYCYARDTHHWAVARAASMEHPAPLAREVEALAQDQAFERRILVKENAAAILVRTLNPRKLNGEPLVIGTATDPYQPGERRFRVTRSLLEALMHYRGLRLGIITKSPLITRDTALLAQLSERHRITVNLSLAAIDARLLRRLEPRTPTPQARLRAMRKLTQAGVRTGLLIAPVLPGITDSREALRSLMAAAKACGAAWISAVPLRMGPATRRTLLPWILREKPELAGRYRQHYGNRQDVSREYNRALQARVMSLHAELGIEPRESRRQQKEMEKPEEDLQLKLWK